MPFNALYGHFSTSPPKASYKTNSYHVSGLSATCMMSDYPRMNHERRIILEIDEITEQCLRNYMQPYSMSKLSVNQLLSRNAFQCREVSAIADPRSNSEIRSSTVRIDVGTSQRIDVCILRRIDIDVLQRIDIVVLRARVPLLLLPPTLFLKFLLSILACSAGVRRQNVRIYNIHVLASDLLASTWGELGIYDGCCRAVFSTFEIFVSAE